VEVLGIPTQALLGQLVLGLVNGSFYAILSLGLAVIFGMLNIVNFAHGAFFMVGAYFAWLVLHILGVGYWWALVVVPVAMSLFGACVERALLRWLYELDHLYGLLLTFGLAIVIEGVFRDQFGVSGQPYSAPIELSGATDLGFMYLPNYRAYVVFTSLTVCLLTWLCIERTKIGAILRAATENAALVRAFGINVDALLTFTYAFGVALAAFAGVLAAPITQISPLMGSNIIVVVFAIVVIGGMGRFSARS
jgi:branched-chain amino acid transport system permease protein